MDDGKGHFIPCETRDEAERLSAGIHGRDPENSGVFERGELLEIRGSRFRVDRITRTHLLLRLQRR